MATLHAVDIFTPGAYPKHTYVARPEGFETQLTDALSVKGQVVSLSGPSKSGKTVLIERVVGLSNLIPIGGASIKTPDEVWSRALDWMAAPYESTTTKTGSVSASLQVGAKGEVSAIVAKGEASAQAGASIGGQYAVSNKRLRGGMAEVARDIADSDYVLLIDDFHYMPREAQVEVAKQLKEAVRLGIKIVTASVPHRADDVVRANPELRGRVAAVDLAYWKREELEQIGQIGFGRLNVALGGEAISRFAAEAAGSPQLMQSICLRACFRLNAREVQSTQTTHRIDAAGVKELFEDTASVTDFRSLVDVLDAGPRTRGTDRKVFRFRDGTEGDVYRCILKAMAAEPLRLSFHYDDFVARVSDICVDDHPVGSSIIGTCNHMSKLAAAQFPRERVIDWDETKTVLDIPDPYLLFYLRWSNRLVEQG